MARITADSLAAKNPVFEAILRGDFDGEGLEDLQHAVSIRKKTMFRKGTKVRVTPAVGDGALVGREGFVTKVNSTRISVGFGQRDGFGYPEEYGFPPRMLEVVAP